MSVYSDTQLHRDHVQWTNERALWHDDVRIWEREVEQLEANLRHITAVLAQQKHDLQVHAAAISIYQQRDGRREHALVQCERNGSEECEMLLVHAHEGEIREHERQRERHEEIKASQRRLMADLRALTAAADRLPPSVREDY